MLKECHDCQTKRLAKAAAIKRRAPPDEIKALDDDLTEHLQSMYKQRMRLEQITQMAGHEGIIVENADKCGDDCFYIPNSARASSANMSKYKYRLSLQANVYAGKLYHLMLLLPNLTTGADFGVTSFLSGLMRMFQLGEITSSKRRLLRGMDGGSENVNFVCLGMNSTLVHELHEGSITEIQQHRLPPDHSHYWLTDGTFSVMEGWLCGDGFPGCATVWDLIDYLRSRFARAANFKDKRVEITCLLVTFAFTKWFDGCINQDKIKGIGKPLVWRHRWVEERKEVVVQYKMLLSDEGTFEKDEWGPWLEEWIEHNDPQTGRIELVKVLRSDPAGVLLMKKYPDIGIDPGVTPWAEDSAWKRDKVFTDLARWEYSQLKSAEAETARNRWEALGSWHRSHQTSDTVAVGQPAAIGQGLELRTPLLSWGEMWKVFKTHVNAAPTPAPSAAASSSSQGAASLSRRVDREALSASTSAAEVNVVIHPGYTDKDARVAQLQGHEEGIAYLRDHLSEHKALFLIRLEHKEGELAVGLGRRTFIAEYDDDQAQKYDIEWFERKNKKKPNWGMQPGFRLTISDYDRHRRPIPNTSIEKLSDFLPIAVQLTPASAGTDEPSLSQDCLSALRAFLAAEEGGGGRRWRWRRRGALVRGARGRGRRWCSRTRTSLRTHSTKLASFVLCD